MGFVRRTDLIEDDNDLLGPTICEPIRVLWAGLELVNEVGRDRCIAEQQSCGDQGRRSCDPNMVHLNWPINEFGPAVFCRVDVQRAPLTPSRALSGGVRLAVDSVSPSTTGRPC
jgi:hypothetical protein